MIRIENLKKAFGTHVLFDGFSPEIPDKEFAVFTGASGCGKTTLLNMIGGIEPADSGEQQRIALARGKGADNQCL